MDIEKLIQWSLSHTKASFLHLETHWKNVAEYGRILYNMAKDEQPNRKVIECFAYLHDSCRLDDGPDMEHGARAASRIEEIRYTLLSELSDDEFILLQKACKLHSIADTDDDITVQLCMDADRLDLDRVGWIPDPERMASVYGAEYAKVHHEQYEKNVKKFCL